jgi:radical SAM superfamily enzyme YgiQ (UPF0313 family)
MAKVALITLYDESCCGARSIGAYLEREGHECYIIHFKAFSVPVIRYEDAEAWRIVEASNSKSIPAFFPEGARFISFPTPVSEHERELLIQKLEEIEPDAIGFSLLSTHLHLARDLTARCRKHFPGVPILWGGIHAISATEDCFPDADIVCTGEGETAVAEYLAEPRRRDIKGMWFYDREQDEIQRNPMRELIRDLDSLPFNQWGRNEWIIEHNQISPEAMDHIYVRGNYRILTTRNCPFQCAYCVHSTMREKMKGLGPYCRRRSPDNVIQEIQIRQRDFGLGAVLFADEIFVMGRKWLLEFAEKYQASGLGLPFYGTCHPHTTTKEMLEILKDVGMNEVCVGIQTGSDRIMTDVYERITSNDDIIRLAELFQEVGFERVQYDVLSNTPYEDEEDCQATLDLLCRLPKPFDLWVYKLFSFPTCKMDRLAHRKGSMDEEGFFFYNMLYLLTQQDKLPMASVKSLAEDRFLRQNPAVMSRLAGAILGEDEKVREMGWHIKYLEFQLQSLTLRKLIKLRAKEKLPPRVWEALRSAKGLVQRSKEALSSRAAASF